MDKRTIIYVFSLVIVAGSVGVLTTSAHGPLGHARHTDSEDIKVKINEKLASGEITQEQADKKLEHIDAHIERRNKHQEAVAGFLGLSVEELSALIELGNTIKEIAESQGISEEAFADFHTSQMIARITEKLQHAVESEKLTQDEADEKLEVMKERIESGEGKLHRSRLHKKLYREHQGAFKPSHHEHHAEDSEV